ncbi:hypothetical protein cyc_09090 [Cyclospora cayetanensis]|uniref:Uncharacterized protein n=1 Tax=Cyclospora cayetanensis TaxID=88456 RepID=A0A1D3DAN1_9EIME|nr:hypothetical protein cyc_09090 [Cyclospora cayetanensis]
MAETPQRPPDFDACGKSLTTAARSRKVGGEVQPALQWHAFGGQWVASLRSGIGIDLQEHVQQEEQRLAARRLLLLRGGSWAADKPSGWGVKLQFEQQLTAKVASSASSGGSSVSLVVGKFHEGYL